MLYIFNKDDDLIHITSDFEDDTYKRVINNQWSFKFDINISKLKEYIKRKNKVGFYDKDDRFQLFSIEGIDVYYNDEIATVNCLHDFYSLNESILESFRVESASCLEALAGILKNSNYSPGIVSDLGLYTINCYDESRLKSLNKLIKIYGGELDFRYEFNNSSISKKYIDVKYRLGEDTGLRFTYDTNLKEVKKNISQDNHFTVLYGRGYSLGKDKFGNDRKLNFNEVTWKEPENPADKPKGNTYIEDIKAIQKWGRIEGIFDDNSIIKKEILIQKTWDKLQQCKEPKISYSATVEDISNLIEYEHYKSTLGDTIIILDEEHDLVVEARILQEEYSIKDIIYDDNTRQLDNKKIKITLGDFQTGLTDDVSNEIDKIKDKVDNVEVEVDNSNFPDTLPSVPQITALGLFATIALEWTFENKLYYNYEVFSSRVKDFAPDPSNLIYKGQASAMVHEVKPKETWYYRVRAGNTHDKFTDYSPQISASTTKLSDAAEYIEEAAISHALIGSLNADKIIAGKVKGTFIDAKNLTVTDGNNEKTLEVDSFGKVHINATTFSLQGKNITEISTESANIVVEKLNQLDIYNKLTNNGQMQGIFLENGRLYLNASYINAGFISGNIVSGGIIEGSLLRTYAQNDSRGVRIKSESIMLNNTAFHFKDGRFKIESVANTSISSMENIYLMAGLNQDGTPRGDGEVVVPCLLSTNALKVNGVEITPGNMVAVFG
ncbi:MAG: phage tail spike protein [Clostridium sp.]